MALAKRIIPCLDVDKGRVVKGVNFVDIRDAGDPVEVARKYNEQGADEITFLDITASHESRDTTYETVERMAAEVFIPLTVGGGVRTVEDIRKLLNAGADKVLSILRRCSIRTSCAKRLTVLVASVSLSPLMPNVSLVKERSPDGRSSPTVGASRQGWMPLNGLAR